MTKLDIFRKLCNTSNKVKKFRLNPSIRCKRYSLTTNFK